MPLLTPGKRCLQTLFGVGATPMELEGGPTFRSQMDSAARTLPRAPTFGPGERTSPRGEQQLGCRVLGFSPKALTPSILVLATYTTLSS